MQRGLLKPNHIKKERNTKSEGDKTKTLKRVKSRNKKRKNKEENLKKTREKRPAKELARRTARSAHLETFARVRLLLLALLLSWDH